jgi:hypothetical protein
VSIKEIRGKIKKEGRKRRKKEKSDIRGVKSDIKEGKKRH